MKRAGGCNQSKIPVCKRKEREYFQVKTRTKILLLWEQEAEKGDRKRLLGVIKSSSKTSESGGSFIGCWCHPEEC